MKTSEMQAFEDFVTDIEQKQAIENVEYYLRSLLKSANILRPSTRHCLYAFGLNQNNKHEIALVIENESGYCRSVHTFTKDQKDSEEVNDIINEINAEFGISEDNQIDILASSMRLGKVIR